MLVQFVQFETSLPEDELWAKCKERQPQYEALKGLVQKYYLKLDKPNHYGGVMVWDTPEALAAFRQSDLARTIGSAYQVVGAPDVRVYDLLFPLRPEALPAREAEAA